MNNSKLNNYVVSVRLMTYNHELFIEDALKGIDIQQTNFQFEIVVGDDFSTDQTLKKIFDYQFSNPNLTLNILKREIGDEYYKNRKEKGRLFNFANTISNCKGKYIALLDGDDYWTDPLKLQKQVDFLEENEEYNICFTRSYMLKNSHFVLQEIPQPFENTPFYYIELLRHFNFMLTASVVFRKPDNNSFPNWFNEIPFGDLALYKIVSHDKKIGCINEIMSVYRIHEKGIWSLLKPIEAKIQYLDFYKKIYYYLSQEEKIIVSDKIKKVLFQVSQLKYPKNALINKIYYHYKLMIFNKYMNTNSS